MTGKAIMDERGKDYGSPLERLSFVDELNEIFLKFREKQDISALSEKEERAFRQIIREEFNKISRLAVTPRHLDSWNDVSGYAECGKESLIK